MQSMTYRFRGDRLTRWLGPLLAGLLWIALTLLFGWLYVHVEMSGGFSPLIKSGLSTAPVRQFLWNILCFEIIPLYLSAMLLLWMLLPLALMILPTFRSWVQEWTLAEGFLGCIALMGALHLGLWWQVPSTLWVLTWLNRLPFWALFPVMAALMIGPFACLMWRRVGLPKSITASAFALALGFAASYIPAAFKPQWKPRPTGHEARLVMLAIDGLRRDTAEKCGMDRLEGLVVPCVYSPIPATRMLYSLLWGGDPDRYTSSLVVPEIDEILGKVRYPVLDDWSARGLKVRFYIDDAGTIGLNGRDTHLDDMGMPAPGWESFLDSNFSANLPFYASWLSVLRNFPGTHPWSQPAEGLIQALERGRGSDWFMYHCCLTHQPIYLTRKEMHTLGRWWTLKPRQLRPIGGGKGCTPDVEKQWDSRQDPLKAYEIRVKSLMDAWVPIINSLSTDGNYQKACRVFFSDHGEHFFSLTKQIRISGLHGFFQDPWELKVPFVLMGHGIEQGRLDIKPRSLLLIKNLIQEAMKGNDQLIKRVQSHLKPAGKLHFRLATQDIAQFIPVGYEYKTTTFNHYLGATFFLPGGIWGIASRQDNPKTQIDFSVAILDEDELLNAYRPLKKGGAQKLIYAGENLIREFVVDEKEYQTVQQQVMEAIKTRPLWK